MYLTQISKCVGCPTRQWLTLTVGLALVLSAQLFSALASANELAPQSAGTGSIGTSKIDARISDIANKNAELSKELIATATALGRLRLDRATAEAVNERILADFSDARATLETVGRVYQGLGPLLRQHHDSLPDARHYAGRIERRARKIAELGVRRLLHREEFRQLEDPDNTIIEQSNYATTEAAKTVRQSLRELLQQRQSLLEKALQQDEIHMQALQKLDVTERELLSTLQDYDEFLREHLWWLRGASPISLNDFHLFFATAGQWFTPARWIALATSTTNQLKRSPLIWLAAIITVVLLWKRRAVISAIQACSKNLGKISTDRLSDTFKALFWTKLIALPVPLILLVVTWQFTALQSQLNSTSLLDPSLLHLCVLLYIVQLLRWACIPGGLAELHFRWAPKNLTLLRRELSRLSWIYIPSSLLVWFVYTQHSVDAMGLLPRLGFLVFQIALSLTLYRLLHRERGVISARFLQRSKGFLYRFYPLGFWFLVLFPLWLGIEMLGGYVHSSIAVSGMLLSTIGLGIVLVLLYALARRWLLVVHRRLAYDAALERRRTILAAREAKETGEEEIRSAELILEEPEVNLTEISENTRGLVGIMMLVIGTIGLYLIWMPIFPALRVFETVNLWHRTVTIDGEITRIPTTLADMGRALLIIVATVVLVSRLPSALEIILLQRARMTESGRYTLTKLTTYALVAIGSLLALNTIGASWSQLQWLVAAMGVGIGFGLQEIVANFISGLIILFERPIRIGDVVTIDDTSGIVTKIRIRATTIRDWDRKELLVPNKDLITGRVLNWSLSDEMTRIVITVGVAYDTDIDKALELMKSAASEHEHALDDPAPLLSFDSFGEHAIELTMRVYVSSISHRIKTVTDLRKAINVKFHEAGIAIAYPQRDVHFDTRDPLRISIESAQPMADSPDLKVS